MFDKHWLCKLLDSILIDKANVPHVSEAFVVVHAIADDKMARDREAKVIGEVVELEVQGLPLVKQHAAFYARCPVLTDRIQHLLHCIARIVDILNYEYMLALAVLLLH